MTVATPDVAVAMVSQLLTCQDIVDLVESRIEIWTPGRGLPQSWLMPIAAITVTQRGGDAPQPYLQRPRFELRCWGADEAEADLLWRTVYGWLMAPQGGPVGFSQTGVVAYTVSAESGPLALVDPDTHWPYSMGTFRPLFAAVGT